jgi:hypothetical protein
MCVCTGGRGTASVRVDDFSVLHQLRSEKSAHPQRWGIPEIQRDAENRYALTHTRGLVCVCMRMRICMSCVCIYVNAYEAMQLRSCVS